MVFLFVSFEMQSLFGDVVYFFVGIISHFSLTFPVSTVRTHGSEMLCSEFFLMITELSIM